MYKYVIFYYCYYYEVELLCIIIKYKLFRICSLFYISNVKELCSESRIMTLILNGIMEFLFNFFITTRIFIFLN